MVEMNRFSIKVSSNWSHIGGCSFPQCVQERSADHDIFLKPDITELVNEERSILLSKEESLDNCELYVSKFPHYKIQAVSFVCNAAKVEIFQGAIMEYMETLYGAVVDQTDDQFKSYRYDIEIEKSGVTDLTLKFLTNSSEICIFGFILHTSPNPNGITSLLPFNHCLNVQNVSKTKVNPNTVLEKNVLLEVGANVTRHNSLTLDQHFLEKLNIGNEGDDQHGKTNRINEDMLDSLKCHIDRSFEEIVKHFNNKLTEMEQRQNKKLDKLLHILENK